MYHVSGVNVMSGTLSYQVVSSRW